MKLSSVLCTSRSIFNSSERSPAPAPLVSLSSSMRVSPSSASPSASASSCPMLIKAEEWKRTGGEGEAPSRRGNGRSRREACVHKRKVIERWILFESAGYGFRSPYDGLRHALCDDAVRRRAGRGDREEAKVPLHEPHSCRRT